MNKVNKQTVLIFPEKTDACEPIWTKEMRIRNPGYCMSNIEFLVGNNQRE